jgi:signal transduction histidine kinase
VGAGRFDYERRVGSGSVQPGDDGLPSLVAIERRRRRLWLIAGFFLLAASGVVALTLTDVALAEVVPDIPVLRWGLLLMAFAFLLYVFDQERLLRSFTRAFVAHDVQTTTLETRVLDLTTLTRVGRTVNSVLAVSEVAETVLDAASELTRARNGSVMLRGDDDLEVVASRGPEAAPVGGRTHIGEGMAGEVAKTLRPLLVTGLLSPDDRADGRPDPRPYGSAVIVPLIAHAEVVGVLSLEREPGDREFAELDLHSVALFAEHAGMAISNAQRYETERGTATRLAEVLELRSEFVAALVHDLKNPITAILGFTSLLHDRWGALEPEDRARSLAAVTSEGERLLEMVEEVLHSTSVDAGAELRRAPVPVAELLEPLIEGLTASTRSQEGVERTVELLIAPGDDLATVLGDAPALGHVFMNLLGNAVKYSPTGSPIEVRVVEHRERVEVAVTDHGDGIPADELPRIFERFRQVPGRSRAGVGLGLYIARTLVTAQGGQLAVDSELGVGSTFRVLLPSVRDASGAAHPAGAVHTGGAVHTAGVVPS